MKKIEIGHQISKKHCKLLSSLFIFLILMGISISCKKEESSKGVPNINIEIGENIDNLINNIQTNDNYTRSG